jgi:hypothetical protein
MADLDDPDERVEALADSTDNTGGPAGADGTGPADDPAGAPGGDSAGA